jgi:hypothetical protein
MSMVLPPFPVPLASRRLGVRLMLLAVLVVVDLIVCLGPPEARTSGVGQS